MRYLDVNFATNELGYELCAAPPGFYTLLDCVLISTCMEKESAHFLQKRYSKCAESFKQLEKYFKSQLQPLNR